MSCPNTLELAPRAEPCPAPHVVDRHGRKQPARFELITERNAQLCAGGREGECGARLELDCSALSAEVARRFCDGMTTRQLDFETVALCIQRAARDPAHDALAVRVLISDLHKRTPADHAALVAALAAAAPTPRALRFSEEYQKIVARGATRIAARLAPARDYRLRYFGAQTLLRSYVLRPGCRTAAGDESSLLDTQLAETPQNLYMRVALGVFVARPDGRGHEAPEPEFQARLEMALELYDALSLQRVSNASPTLFNAGTTMPQLSSCFQLAAGDDLASILDTVKAAGMVSKAAGGVSVALHAVRAEGAPIHRTGGRSTGIKHVLRILNDVQNYVDQGGNRPGATAVYLSPDHADVFTFLALARRKGEEALRGVSAPDLKYALWVPDLFMEALQAELAAGERARAGAPPAPGDAEAGDWPLFSPDSAPSLRLAYGEEYRALHARYLAEGRAVRTVKASDIIGEAFRTWAQTGLPYVLFKDHINRKANMKNVAPICSSNLCCEITIPAWSEFDAPEFARFHPGNIAGEFGVCNLGALCLESFLVEGPGGPALDWGGLVAAAGLEVRALNRIIDLNSTPCEEGRRSNLRHRPVGLGVMGLADVLARLRLPYGSERALRVARAIAAVVYYGALRESAALAGKEGAYATFAGSPLSQGLLQPDLWVGTGHYRVLGAPPGSSDWEAEVAALTGGFLLASDWAALRARVQRTGVRNAYVTAYMPTASTSNIVGQNESFEPFTSNVYTRHTLAGEFVLVNRHLVRELQALGLWDDQMSREVLAAGGSVQALARIPEELRRRFRTAREVHPSLLTRTAAAMAPFVCQSISLNLFLDAPDLPKILRFLFEGWEAGLKCGLYYCHTQPAAGSQKTSARAPADKPPPAACRRDDPACTSCAL